MIDIYSSWDDIQRATAYDIDEEDFEDGYEPEQDEENESKYSSRHEEDRDAAYRYQD